MQVSFLFSLVFTPRIVALSLNDKELQKKQEEKDGKHIGKPISKNLKNCLLTLNFKSFTL